MTVDISMIPSEKLFSVSGDLTSDDATDTHVNLQANLATLKLSEGSTDFRGSARFAATLTGSIERYDRANEKFRMAGNVESQVLCSAVWSK